VKRLKTTRDSHAKKQAHKRSDIKGYREKRLIATQGLEINLQESCSQHRLKMLMIPNLAEGKGRIPQPPKGLPRWGRPAKKIVGMLWRQQNEVGFESAMATDAGGYRRLPAAKSINLICQKVQAQRRKRMLGTPRVPGDPRLRKIDVNSITSQCHK